MPLIHRTVEPRKVSATKLKLDKNDSEFVAVNNGTLVNVLRQLASLVAHANEIFSEVAVLTEGVGKRVRSVKLRLDELEVKAELYDPKLVPVPEGDLEEKIPHRIREVILESDLFIKVTRPAFLRRQYDQAGKHAPHFPLRSPITERERPSVKNSNENRRPASFAALREWKLDDYVDSKIATLNGRKRCSAEDVSRTVSSTFPSQLVTVDVTGRGFDRMKANRRSLVIHTKKIRVKRRRNTICGTMPNKECGIQTSFSSVASPSDQKKYGIDSGHWSSCTESSAQGVTCVPSTSSAPSPWDPTSLSTSSDFLFDDEDRSLTPQLENFTDGMVSDSDSVDTEGYFTSFRNECGFPKSKKGGKDEKSSTTGGSTINLESEYELFGKGSTSTTASSCGTVVMRNKPEPPVRNSSMENLLDKKSQQEDSGWEERVKRKSLIERVPSLVVVTPSPSCSSGSPPPSKDANELTDPEDSDSGRHTPKAVDFSNESGSCTLSEFSDSEKDVINLTGLSQDRPGSSNSTGSSSGHSTRTLTRSTTNLPQPDVIPDVQVIRSAGPKLDIGREYYALDTVLLGSSEEEHHEPAAHEAKMDLPPALSSKIRGARVVLDANGEIIFASETLKRKRRHKVSFDPGQAVKEPDYDSNSNYARIRESVYDRIVRREAQNEELYERIEEIRRYNLKASEESLKQKVISPTRQVLSPVSPPSSSSLATLSPVSSPEPGSLSNGVSPKEFSKAYKHTLLETDLDSAIPPVMPELKNLPKIKDRLKRNESYRIATDEIPPRNPLHTINSKRLFAALASPNGHAPLSNQGTPLNVKEKRDIPEENPAYVQRILSMSSASHSPVRSSPGESLNRIPLSKFALSSDERPSFLRRESPPTMDDISKEIYRFRKKFNIQPAPLKPLTAKTNILTSAKPVEKGTTPTLSPSKSSPPSLLPPRARPTTLPLTSTPLRRTTSESPYDRLQVVNRKNLNEASNASTRNSPGHNLNQAKIPGILARNSEAIKNPNSCYNRLFNSKSNIPTAASSQLPVSPNRGAGASDSKIPQFQRQVSSSLRLKSSVTSLGDFKRLLQSTQKKRSSISAMEALKPKMALETTI